MNTIINTCIKLDNQLQYVNNRMQGLQTTKRRQSQLHILYTSNILTITILYAPIVWNPRVKKIITRRKIKKMRKSALAHTSRAFLIALRKT